MHGRKLGDTTYTFGHEGVLYRESFIMYDKQTESHWVHTTGEAVQGPCKGKVLEFLPSVLTTWKAWKRMHPKTRVLTGKRAKGFMGRYRFQEKPTGYGLSVGQGTTPKLYPFAVLMERRVIQDVHADRPIVVVYDAESRTGRAYARGGHEFAWQDGAWRDEKGHAWDPLRGRPVAKGPKQVLAPLPATTWRIERWHGFHPHAPVYAAPAK